METEITIVGRVVNLYTGRKGTIIEVSNEKNNISYLCKFGSNLYIEVDDTIAFTSSQTTICTWGKDKGESVYIIPTDPGECEIIIPNDEDSVLYAFKNCYGPYIGQKKHNMFLDFITGHAPVTWLNNYSELERHSNGEFKKIYSWWVYHRLRRRLMNLGIKYTEIEKIRYYADIHNLYDLYTEIITNPLKIVAIDLTYALSLCNRLDIEYNEDQLYRARISRTLYDYTEIKRNSSMPCDKLKQEYPDIEKVWYKLKEEYNLIIEYNCYYYKVNWIKEYGLSKQILEYLESNSNINEPPKEVNSKDIDYTRNDIHPEQIKTVHNSLNYKFSIITGGAGNGKTTVIKEIVHNLKIRGIPFLLSSFTGKAVARIKEVAPENDDTVMTLHMILAWAALHKYNEHNINPLHLIIDEASMVTTTLLYDVLSLQIFRSVTLIGDQNQLPPIEWGSVLKELLKIDNIPKVQLVHNHRSNLNATAINKYNDLIPTGNCIIESGDIKSIMNCYKDLLSKDILARDIIIITPVNKYVDIINIECQNVWNNPSYVKDKLGNKFMLGDRIMLVENDEFGNNGDLGNISSVNKGKKEVTVEFPHKVRTFRLAINKNYIKEERSKTTEVLKLAYAVTVHKSQGSQWRHVIIYAPPAIKNIEFYNFNLIYTAISRTMYRLYIYGDIAGLQEAIKWVPPPKNENLAKIMLET